MIIFEKTFSGVSFQFLTPVSLTFALLLLFSGCALLSPGEPAYQQAYSSYIADDHAAALALFEKHIHKQSERGEIVADSIFLFAGMAAWQLGKNPQALDYLNRIRHSAAADGPVHLALAKLNREVDNLSREITALEQFIQITPEEEISGDIRARMFEVYAESRNYDQALQAWALAEPYAKDDEEMLGLYFQVLDQTDNQHKQYETANALLALNPQNTDALYFLGKHYFWLAENRYQKEMEAYEGNRTHRQYSQLLRALDVLNEDFRTSLQYFERLWDIDERSAYAQYLGNIHLRFDNRDKARYYHSRAGQ